MCDLRYEAYFVDGAGEEIAERFGTLEAAKLWMINHLADLPEDGGEVWGVLDLVQGTLVCGVSLEP